MHEFSYRDGDLCCEGVSLGKLASEHGTPLYVYSAKTIRDHYRRLDEALSGLDHRVCFAMKANSNLAVLGLPVPPAAAPAPGGTPPAGAGTGGGTHRRRRWRSERRCGSATRARRRGSRAS